MNTISRILLGLMLGVSVTENTFAASAPFYRFWQGRMRPDYVENAEGFRRKISQEFVPLTVTAASPHGLKGYLPFILNRRVDRALPGVPASLTEALPDEIALVIYESEEKYNAFKATDTGKAYTEAHWEVFDRPTSRSAVPKVLSWNEPELLPPGTTRAFDLLQSSTPWGGARNSQLLIRMKEAQHTEVGLTGYFREIQRLAPSVGLVSAVVLESDTYVIEYLLWDFGAQPVGFQFLDDVAHGYGLNQTAVNSILWGEAAYGHGCPNIIDGVDLQFGQGVTTLVPHPNCEDHDDGF